MKITLSVKMKVSVLLAVVAACTLMAACSARQPVEAIRRGIVGTWEHEQKVEQKKPSSLSEHVLNVVDKMTVPSPYPDRLVFHPDGTYEATYSGKQLEGIRRRRESEDLDATVTGTYELSADWSGLTWIEMDNGVPERRITVNRNTLILHKARDGWTAEKFVRPE